MPHSKNEKELSAIPHPRLGRGAGGGIGAAVARPRRGGPERWDRPKSLGSGHGQGRHKNCLCFTLFGGLLYTLYTSVRSKIPIHLLDANRVKPLWL